MNLKRMLLFDIKRSHMKEQGLPGLKTPLVLKTSFHEDVKTFHVSCSTGKLLQRGNSDGGVPSGFFELPVEGEDQYMSYMIDHLYTLGLHQNWGNGMEVSSLSVEDVQSIDTFFDSYDLLYSQVFCGLEGFRLLTELPEMMSPNPSVPLDPNISETTIQSLVQEHFVCGLYDNRPVYYHQGLGPYLVFSVPSESLGFITRIEDHVSVVVHNASRGLVIIRSSHGS